MRHTRSMFGMLIDEQRITHRLMLFSMFLSTSLYNVKACMIFFHLMKAILPFFNWCTGFSFRQMGKFRREYCGGNKCVCYAYRRTFTDHQFYVEFSFQSLTFAFWEATYLLRQQYYFGHFDCALYMRIRLETSSFKWSNGCTHKSLPFLLCPLANKTMMRLLFHPL